MRGMITDAENFAQRQFFIGRRIASKISAVDTVIYGRRTLKKTK
jgi:hypothetical protein